MKTLSLVAIALVAALTASPAPAAVIVFNGGLPHGGPGSIVIELAGDNVPIGCQFETDGRGLVRTPTSPVGTLEAFGEFLGPCAPTPAGVQDSRPASNTSQ